MPYGGLFLKNNIDLNVTSVLKSFNVNSIILKVVIAFTVYNTVKLK